MDSCGSLRLIITCSNLWDSLWLLESDSSVDTLVLILTLVRMIVHHEGEVVLGQLDWLVVDLDDERVSLDVVDGELDVAAIAAHARAIRPLLASLLLLVLIRFE